MSDESVGEAVADDVDALLVEASDRDEWQAGIESVVCFIAGCDYTDIDPRGPVWVCGVDGPTPHCACTEHWEAIFGILGRQVGSDDEMRSTP